MLIKCFLCIYLKLFKSYFQLHTSEVQDGSDWNRLNLQSVTEQNTLEEFLETAELAGVEFTAGDDWFSTNVEKD